jgi:L-arabinose isomerase
VIVGVPVKVADWVAVSVGVRVSVKLRVTDEVRVAVRVELGVTDGDAVRVSVKLGLAVKVMDGVADGNTGVADRVTLTVGLGLCVGVAVRV